MIQLTRLNNSSLIVNSDLIKFVEQSPDTVITLLNGEKIIVRESAHQVLERIVQFRRTVLQNPQAAAGYFSPLPAADCRKEAEEQSER
ncbi:MAG: flagellar FlbD family protein [Terriglobales bacterium]